MKLLWLFFKVILLVIVTTFLYSNQVKHWVWARRTKAEQEVLALIAPHARLGRFEVAVHFFQVSVLQLAYRVGWSAIVLLGLSFSFRFFMCDVIYFTPRIGFTPFLAFVFRPICLLLMMMLRNGGSHGELTDTGKTFLPIVSSLDLDMVKVKRWFLGSLLMTVISKILFYILCQS